MVKAIDERAKRRALAVEVEEAVKHDRPLLPTIHDYRDGPLGPRTAAETEEAIAIDATKFGDLDASLSIETELAGFAVEIGMLYEERGIAQRASRMDENERQAFRAWMLERRDKIVEKALEIAKHWGEQGGVNGAYLDELAELAGHPTRGYRRGT